MQRKWLDSGMPIVDVDEGWAFTLDPRRRHIKVLPPELVKAMDMEEPNTTLKVQSKANIPKVMVVTAITRPRAVPGVGYVGGQVGIWKVWSKYTAQRKSWKLILLIPMDPRLLVMKEAKFT